MFVSVTRLHLSRWWFFPFFAIHSYRSLRQARNSAGFVDGRLAPEPLLGFWTITVWTDETAMRGFRNSGPHLKAMPRLLDWCDEASYAHWHQDDSSVPAVEVAFERLRDAGKASKVRHPSASHSGGNTTGTSMPKAAGAAF